LPANLPPATSLDSQPILADLSPGLPSDLLQRRPDIQEAEHTLKAANANIGAARAAFFPKILLTGSAGSASADLSGLFAPGSSAWSFSPQITVPIFDTGANKAGLDVATIGKRIDIAQYEKSIQTAFREVSDALAAQSAWSQQLDANRRLASAQQHRYDLADTRYQQGADSYLGVLTAQQDLFSSQQVLIQTRFSQLVNQIELYRALGGGWTDLNETQASNPTSRP
jgi:multidrug efflux system outer membrane protein